MRKYVIRIAIIAPAVFLFTILFSCTGRAEVNDTVTRTFEVEPGGQFELTSDRGSIHVQSHKESTVIVNVERSVDVLSNSKAKEIMDLLKLDFAKTDNTVRVEGKVDQGVLGLFDGTNKLRVKYKILVPMEFNLNMKTAGGSVRIDDLNGEVRASTAGGSMHFGTIQGLVEARTAGGSIRLEGSGGNVSLQTAGGSIEAGSIDGDCQAKTSGGSIRLGEVNGEVEAKTAGGSISIDGVTKAVNARTSGGSIRAVILAQPTGESRLATSAGNVSVTLPENISLNVNAQTLGGKVSTDLPITVKGEISKSHIKGLLNGGGPLLLLETAGGNISISKGREIL